MTFSLKNEKVEMTSDREDIERSLQILLGTVKGERVMRPGYGCNLNDMVFESFNLTLKNYLMDLIKTAILYYEARIEPTKIAINERFIAEGRIDIEIEYLIRSTNSRFNFVYPFYINEGSEIPQFTAS